MLDLAGDIIEPAAYGLGTLGYLLVGLIVCFGRRPDAERNRVLAALATVTAVTAAWSAAHLIAPSTPMAWTNTASQALEVMRAAAWPLLILAVLDLLRADGAKTWFRKPIALTGSILMAAGVADALVAMSSPGGLYPGLDLRSFTILGLTLLGILLVENLFQQLREDTAWAFKHLVIAAAMLFAFELAYIVGKLLLYRTGVALETARVLVSVLVLPLVMVSMGRLRGAAFRVTISRDAVFHTTTLLLSGLYLIAAAALGFYVQRSGGVAGPAMQIVMFFGAVMVLALALLSTRLRAQLRSLIARNFFAFHYDYRQEWLRFIRRMSTDDSLNTGLQGRAVRALADIFECDRGALFLTGPDSALRLSTRLNLSMATDLSTLPIGLAQRLAVADVAIELPSLIGTEGDQPDADAELLGWLERLPRPWLLMPLRWRDDLVGAILLCDRRIERPVTWEDQDLLSILAVQVGSYIAEDQATRRLLETQRFEQISKNFSFVAHDLKNLVSQLSLITQNAHKHGDNPEFQRDALETIGNSVEKMQAMLVRLRDRGGRQEDLEPIDLRQVIEAAGHSLRRLMPKLTVIRPHHAIYAPVDPLGLGAVIDNLLHNALEAAGRDGHFEIGLGEDGNLAFIWISDDGPGMSRSFIDKRLAEPFGASSKPGGFGIGLYQTREFVERYGGTCRIDSDLGKGTTVRLSFPLAEADNRPAASMPRATRTQNSISDGP